MKIEITIDNITEREVELIENFLIDNGIDYKTNVTDNNKQDEENYKTGKLEEYKRYYDDRD